MSGGTSTIAWPGQNIDTGRVKQQSSRFPPGSLRVNLGVEIKPPLTRRLHEAAIAAVCPALRKYAAVRTGGVVGPKDNLATVAVIQGISLDGCVFPHVSGFSILDSGIFTLIIPADQDGAAAAFAGDVNPGVIDQANVIAEDPDITAFAVIAGSRDCAGYQRGS